MQKHSFFKGYIPLHLASMQGHVGVVGLLLSRSTSLLKIVDSKGQNCLHHAAKNGHYEMVSVLVGQGSDSNIADKDGWTPLHCASQVRIIKRGPHVFLCFSFEPSQ